MPASNAFINGFMGGMGAMNNMIDSKARREEAKWRQGLIMEDRQFQAQERERIERLRGLSGTLHQYNGLDAAGKKSAGKAFVTEFNQIPGMAQFVDNGNPAERVEVEDFRFTKDKSGNTFVVPVAGVYDAKTNKRLRSGDFTSSRENGGSSMGIPISDFSEFLASREGSGAVRALEADILRQGGTIPKRQTSYGNKYVYNGRILQDDSTGKTLNLGRAYDGSSTGTGKSGTWKNYQTREIQDPAFPDDPSKMLTEVVQYLDNGDGTTSVRGMVDHGGGQVKINAYGVTNHSQPKAGGSHTGLDGQFDFDNQESDSGEVATKTEEKDGKDKPVTEKNPPLPVAEQAALPVNQSAMHGRAAYGAMDSNKKTLAERQARINATQKKFTEFIENLRNQKQHVKVPASDYGRGMSEFRGGYR